MKRNAIVFTMNDLNKEFINDFQMNYLFCEMGQLPDGDDFSARRFAPLPREPTGCFAKGMELSPILSAGGDSIVSPKGFHMLREYINPQSGCGLGNIETSEAFRDKIKTTSGR